MWKDWIRNHRLAAGIWTVVLFVVVTFPVWLAQVWPLFSDRPFVDAMTERGWTIAIVGPSVERTKLLPAAELHFGDGPLQGLKLIGFGIWERRTGSGRNVTCPTRNYSVNGERRIFALLRPVVER
jgi:hypothetical protein